MANTYYLLIHARGGDLGNFKVFSDTEKNTIKATDKSAVVVQESAERARRFFEILQAWEATQKIKQLHIWSHSIGAGLFLGYQDPTIDRDRNSFIARMTAAGRKPTFDEVRQIEVGALFTDDLLASPFLTSKTEIAGKFAAGAWVKIWGCNAAVTNWIYSDTAPDRSLIVDARDTRAVYYWRALNEHNQPKPSIQKALGDYFGVDVYGASSSSNIQVMRDKVWIGTAAYKEKFGKVPPGSLPHRLQPRKGDYGQYKPKR